jgi:trans-aconitate 3-methyltransferase
MSQSTSSNPSHKEKTFTAYTASQGKAYSTARRDYHPTVYSTVLTQHTTTGGQLSTLLDIGCGTGLAIRALSPKFTTSIGLDPSYGMLETARSLSDPSSPNPIRYELSSSSQLGSNLDPPIPDGSVDLIVAANAAHWFDMPAFWTAAARVLKPGGTVALWTSGEIRAHPSTAAADEIQKAWDAHREKYLAPFYEEGNHLTRTQYANLGLPWTTEPKIGGFTQEGYLRKVWDGDEEFFTGGQEVGMDMLEKMLATASPVTRWREANKDKVGTEEDCIRILRRTFEGILRGVGVKEGEEKVRGCIHGALVVVKKAAE